MLSDSRVEANIPAGDIERAKAFYADKLGLTRSTEVMPGYVRYETAGGTAFNLYQTQFAGTAGHTIAQIHVDDVEKEVADLKARGVDFEVYDDMPGVEWRGEVAVMPGMGKAAWFKDSEGNILCVDEPETA
ncbi:MAG TPA: VOC family protein [Kineosporiaceae bacterium]|jgi:predicted enzyme related to lactoylglutathione lyase|nr:VOC family protein [Kineosporiaceae bacterium]